MKLPILAAVLVVPFGPGCAGDAWEAVELPEDVHRYGEFRSRLVAPPEPELLAFDFVLGLPDSLDGRFQMGYPVAMDAIGSPYCRVAVADRYDRAIHVFGTRGQHAWSRFGNGRGELPDLGKVTSVSWRPDGHLLVAVAPDHLLTFGDDGTVLELRHLPRLDPGSRGLRRIEAGLDGQVLDHWFGETPKQLPSRDVFPSGELPLILWRTANGDTLGSFGRVTPFPGASLTTVLNQGFMDVVGDTLWFASAGDATLSGYDVRSLRRELPRTIQLPVFFNPSEPVEYQHRESGQVASRVMTHLRDFRANERGFFAVQMMQWPDAGYGIHAPRVALVEYSPRGDMVRVLAVRTGSLLRIAVSGGTVFSLVSSTGRVVVGASDAVATPGDRCLSGEL